MSLNKKANLIKTLRQFADILEKDSVEVVDVYLSLSQNMVEGVDPDNYQYTTHHPDGSKRIELSIDYYDAECDKRHEAGSPMQEILKYAEKPL